MRMIWLNSRHDISRHHWMIIWWTYEIKKTKMNRYRSFIFKDKKRGFIWKRWEGLRGGSLIFLCVYIVIATYYRHQHQHHLNHHHQTMVNKNEGKERQRNFMQIYLYVGYTSIYYTKGRRLILSRFFLFFFFFVLFFDQMRNEMYSKNVHCAIYIYLW